MSDQAPNGTESLAILLTDVVDSTALVERLGPVEAARLWAAHDTVARALLPEHRGREIDKTDGFLLLFRSASDALSYAGAYHTAIGRLDPPLTARAGVHVGELVLRQTPAAEVALGAKPLEVDGPAKPLAARVMSVAPGGRTLLTEAAREALEPALSARAGSQGHWQLKGLTQPVELFELDGVDLPPPADAPKAYRVVRRSSGVWVPVADVPNNLPAERNAFFGRLPELRELRDRLHRGQRLVTLLGPGGTGKSRLSLEFALRWRGDWPGGTWFCALEEVHTEADLVAAVARVAGIRLEGGDPVAWVGAMLAEREPSLFMLDNFEQLAAHAGVIARWIAAAPNATWVVSSRERLQLDAEHVIRLEALPLPAPGAAPREAMANAAVQLFGTRATAASDRFAVTVDNVSDVAELVRLLDGMPLAIELAAARVPVMGPRTMVERMSQRFKLLGATRRGVTRRQATLRGAIDWSWDLIEPWERLALAQCSVFRGGFTVAAAEVVLDLSAWPDAPWPADVVQGLVDKSLLRTLDGAGPSRRDAEPLLGLYQCIRDYADEKLRDPAAVAGPDGAPLTGPERVRVLQLGHAEHYGGQAVARRRQAETREGLDGLEAERDNLAAAMEHALAHERPELAADCWVLLAILAVHRGPVEPTWGRFARLRLEPLAADRQIEVLRHQSQLAHNHGVVDPALSQRIVDLVVASGDERSITVALVEQARAMIYQDRKGTGRRLAALEDRVRADGDRRLLASWLVSSAMTGPNRESARRLEEALALDPDNGAAMEYNLSVFALGARDYDGCSAWLRRFGERVAAMGCPPRLEMLHRQALGLLLILIERTDEAGPHLERGFALCEQLGDRRFLAGSCSQGLALLQLQRGELAGAHATATRALKILRVLPDRSQVAWGLSTLARVLVAQGDVAAARTAIDEALALAPDIADAEPHLHNFTERALQIVVAAERAHTT